MTTSANPSVQREEMFEASGCVHDPLHDPGHERVTADLAESITSRVSR